MMKKVFHLSILIIAVSAVMNLQPLSAEGYQVEASGSYFYSKTDSIKYKEYSLFLTGYFQEVNTDGKPYAEAAFLQKTGYLTVTGTKIKDDEGSEGEFSGLTYGGELGIVFPVVPVFIKGGYLRNDSDGDWNYDRSINTFSGEIGYYLTDNLAVAGNFVKEFAHVEYDTYPKTETKNSTYGCNFKYVNMISNTMALNIEGSYDRISSKTEGLDKLINNEYVIGADFYFTPQIGIGGSIEINKGDDKDYAGNTYKLQASAFLTQNIGIFVGIGKYKAEDSATEDETLFYASVKGRI